MQKLRIVTTSWDDGDRDDLKLAETLRSRGISGTFYVPTQAYGGRPALIHNDLRSLSSEGFEIGAHSVTHKLLWRLPADELAAEIGPCKPTLEDILGKEVRMFCYPCGRYDSNVIQQLKRAGYRGARTVRMLSTQLKFKPFEMPTTVQVMPHRRSAYVRNVLRARKVEGVQRFFGNLPRLENWVELGKRLFDSVLQNGGIWHLWGHSHEIEKMRLWRDLEEILDYVGKREGVVYVPNGEVNRMLCGSVSSPGNGQS